MIDKDKLSHLLVQLQGDESQRVLARGIGVSPYTINGWIRGNIIPNQENLIKIAKFINKPLDHLLSIIGDEDYEVESGNSEINLELMTAEALAKYIKNYVVKKEQKKLLKILMTELL